MDAGHTTLPIGQEVSLPGHFDVLVFLEAARPFTRLASETVIRRAIVRGIKECAFAYSSGGVPALGVDGKFQVPPAKVRFDTIVADDEIDVESGFVFLPNAIPQPPSPTAEGGAQPGSPPPTRAAPAGTQPGSGPSGGTPNQNASGARTSVELSFDADRNQLFSAWNAIANLADIAGKVAVTVKAENATGLDKSKLQNGVIEPLREANLIE